MGKRGICLLAAASFLLSLSGCKGEEESTGSADGMSESEQREEASGPERRTEEGGVTAVTFRGNGHTAGTLPEPVRPNEHGTFTINDSEDLSGPAIRDGITRRHVGWNTAPDGSGESFAKGGYGTVSTPGLVLHAQWSAGDDVVGLFGPGGGFVFHDKGDETGAWRYLEVAPPSTFQRTMSFGIKDLNLEGTSPDLGAGKENTRLVVEALEAAGESGMAAQYCAGLDAGGKSDWYLPAPEELRLLFSLNSRSGERLVEFRSLYWTSNCIMHGPIPATAQLAPRARGIPREGAPGIRSNTARVVCIRQF